MESDLPRRAAARPAGLLADRRAADGDHQRLHHRSAGCATPILVGRGVRRPGPARRALPAPDRTRGDGRGDHRRGRRPDGAAGHHLGGRGRFARHRLGGGRRAGRRPGHRLRVVGHLVPGRAGARRARDHRRQSDRQLHQRGWGGRAGAVPAQRRRPLAAAGVSAGVGGRGPGVRPRGAAGERRAAAGRWTGDRRRRRAVSSPRTRCPPGSGPRAVRPANRFPTIRRASSAACWTRWRSRTRARSSRPSS